MDGLGVATCPHCGILNGGSIAERVRCLNLKRCAVGMLPGFLIVAIVGEIVIEKAAIISEEIRDAFLFLGRGFADRHDGTCLHGFTPLLPLFDSFLSVLSRVPCHTLKLCDLAPEEFKDIFILILVHHFAELGSNLGVGLGLVFEPTTECHKALNEIDGRGFLVEAFNGS